MKDKMKNIHILPTDKPSLIAILPDKELTYSKTKQLFTPTKDWKTQNIYITSNEEIKEGDWCYYLNRFGGGNIICQAYRHKDDARMLFAHNSSNREIGEGIIPLKDECKKIILTDNSDLIKDGVQAIDDEFLEWFVKNPSCEFVEVDLWTIEKRKGEYLNPSLKEYEIIIPKEEPKKVLTEEDIFNQKDIDAVTDYINKEQQKQHLIDMMESDEELGLYDETIDSIKLEEVFGSKHCLYSVIENKLAILYRNQEKILSAIKILNNGRK
jgi:hypothetical protein